MTHVRYLEMEDIAYKDWSDHLDLVANSRASPWLPAYGYHPHSPLQEIFHTQAEPFISDNTPVGQQQYLVLETIVEETSDDLCSESDKSGPTGWNSDSDTDSVIHLPKTSEVGTTWRDADASEEVPKKRRCRVIDKLSFSDDEEPLENLESTSASSRSSSLLAFESLEKHCEDVFVTTASSDPFGSPESKTPNPLTFLQTFRDIPYDLSISDEDFPFCSSPDTFLRSPTFRSTLPTNFRLRSYRSFDSLNLFDDASPLSYTIPELSQSQSALDHEKAMQEDQGFVIRDKKLTATTADLSTVTDSCDVGLYLKHRRRSDNASFHFKEPRHIVGRKALSAEGLEGRLGVPRKSSVENLSEDSGFDDQIAGRGKLRDECSSASESPSAWPCSDSNGSCEGAVPMEGRHRSKSLNKNGGPSKINDEQESAMGGSFVEKHDVEVNFNPGQTETHMFNCIGEEGLFKQGEAEKLIATPVTFASPERKDSSESYFNAHVPPTSDLITDQRISESRANDFFCKTMSTSLEKTPGKRLPVSSTPNLLAGDDYFVRGVPSASSSLTHVPLKCHDADELDGPDALHLLHLRDSRLISSLNCPTGSIKGVHFCPVVSEVSWQDSYTDSSSSEPSTDEPSDASLQNPCHIQHEDEEPHQVEQKSIPRSTSPPRHRTPPHDQQRPVTPPIHATPTSSDHVFFSDPAQANADTRTSLSVSESRVSAQDCASAAARDSDCPESAPVAASGAAAAMKKSKSRFGGFFERFSFRRRKGSDGSAKKQDKREKDAPRTHGRTDSNGNKEDVTIIPLRGPENEAEVNEIVRSVVTPHVVAAKPPLPPNLQRMSGGPRRRSPPSGTVSLGLQDEDHHGKGITAAVRANVRDSRENILGDAEKPVGLLETDLDTHVTVESAARRPLAQCNAANTSKKARSLMNLGLTEMSVHREQEESLPSGYLDPPHGGRAHSSVAIDDRAKSMEFLLDKENHAAILNEMDAAAMRAEDVPDNVNIGLMSFGGMYGDTLEYHTKPPENELQKGGTGERVMSEHQLRVQRSLQKLNIPDWYKTSAVAQTPQGFLLKRDSRREHQGWPGLGSKTTSLSSLGSSSARSPTSHVLSPSPTPHLFTRWSTSRLNSGFNSSSTSPSGSARSSFNYRQPYLGWRSQEKLTRPRTPAERLAAGLLPLQKHSLQCSTQSVLNPNLSDVQTSIKEVTSAIVHYVSGVQEHGSRETVRSHHPSPSPGPGPKWQSSPRGSSGKLCWVESSFVGSRPLDQPETPLSLTEPSSMRSESNTSQLYLDLKPQSDVNHVTCHPLNEEPPGKSEEEGFSKARHSPASTTLDDILESLLGLPPTSRSPSPGPLCAAAFSPSPARPLLPLPDRQHHRLSCGDIRADVSESASDPGNASFAKEVMTQRRKSECGSEVALNRQVLLERKQKRDSKEETNRKDHSSDNVVKCRYSKCGKTATVLDAKKSFKTCHNCSHVYCSRECRRAHWERHRRTCLHSRIGALCKQVLSTIKDDPKALHHLSLLARRGYLTHGRGAVKIYFSSPELAEKFVARGFDDLGEPAYVKWSDLLPAEMGADLFAELMKICKSYNPDTRLVLYVAVCVVSEVPSTGAVKWERQLVSRCCKLQLDKSLVPPKQDKDLPPPLPPRRSSSECTNITREMDNPETLILTSLPPVPPKISDKKLRQTTFTNIHRELKQRGVSLRRQFPEVYKKLCSYVEGTNDHFAPTTIYPRNAVSGKTFMCIIMPDSGPEKLQMVPKDSSRVQTIDVSIDRKSSSVERE